MTYKSFIEALSKTRGWRLTTYPGLTSTDLLRRGHTCPLRYIAGLRGDSDYEEAAEILRMRPTVAWRIMAAADHYVRHNHTTRRDLMRACHLKEPRE